MRGVADWSFRCDKRLAYCLDEQSVKVCMINIMTTHCYVVFQYNFVVLMKL